MKTKKGTFPILGMTCASCASSVEKAISAQKGIVAASVNYASATAFIEYEPSYNVDNIKTVVRAIGYDAIIAKENMAEKVEALNKKAYDQLFNRTVISIFLSAPLLLISMFWMHMPYANYIMWALATPIVLYFGRQFFIGAFKHAMHLNANMDTLVALSTGIAYAFSVFNTLNPAFWTDQGLEGGVYFEASAVVIAFILLGKLLEARAKNSTSSAIKKMMSLQPDTVTRIGNNGEEIVPLEAVHINDLLVVKPGERIPVDGLIVSGKTFIDESMITGEPMPVEKAVRSKVIAGTINQLGNIKVSAEKIGNDTLLAQIIQQVQTAQGSKAPIQQLVDKIASVFVPIVILISLATLVIWVYFGGEQGLLHGLLAMVTVLVVACPCALGLATPTAIVVGIGQGAEQGILVKDAQSLELIPKMDTIVFDKTGTLTEGTPQVVDMGWAENVDPHHLSAVLYSMEMMSEHPLAGAITSFFKGINTQNYDMEHFSSISGSGVTAVYQGTIYFAGNLKLLDSMRIKHDDVLMKKATLWTEQANTVIYLSDPFRVLAAVAIADKVKLTSASAVQLLEQKGLDVYMLTGDNEHTAYAIARETQITKYKAEATPTEKAAFIKKLQDEGHVVGMVGDGINDSLALAQADISIAMGSGSDIAMDVAKMTLISSDLKQITKAINMAEKTVKTINQNLFWAFFYNVLAIPLAAGALYPVNGFMLNPMLAGAAMTLSSLSVVLNSLRLKMQDLS